jgi:NADPH:quinone reductase
VIKVTRTAIIDAPIERVWALIRDFNGHDHWHPAVAYSEIENGEAPDQLGCVRNFKMQDGGRIREQLLSLSDRDHSFTYCILDATVPLKRYVATCTLKPVTDGNQTYWWWQSTFDTPKGQERELAALVGEGVYQGGFDGARAFLRQKSRLSNEALVNKLLRTRPQQTFASRVGQVANPNLATSAASSYESAFPSVTGQAIVVAAHGGTEQMRLQSVKVSGPKAGEVRLKQTAIGVNYIDVYVRTGQYKMLTPPGVIGMEAAGVVTEVGQGVTQFLPGDRVAYACPPVGAYTSVRTMSADQLVLLPDYISDEVAAALMLKGMTAEYLLHRTCRVTAGTRILVHAAAGGVGLLLCQWASALGAIVIGTVSSEDKARLAREYGCHHPIITKHYDFAGKVKELTQGEGADIIYDGLGKEAFNENLETLAMCGHWVSFGQASGAYGGSPTEQLLAQLSAKSITLSRPVLFHYTAKRDKLNAISARTFDAVKQGIIKVPIHHRYPLSAAGQAHIDLEARRTTGSIVLIP